MATFHAIPVDVSLYSLVHVFLSPCINLVSDDELFPEYLSQCHMYIPTCTYGVIVVWLNDAG